MIRCAVALAVLIGGWTITAHAETPASLCRRVGTDDTTRPIPAGLVPAVNRAFGTRMPTKLARDTTVYRCAEGRVWVCTVGANLPCGKANADRSPGEGTLQWCRDNPDADVVPAVATGHDTIYEWRCQGGMPAIVRQVLHVDPRGFVTEFWKDLALGRLTP